MKPGKTYAFGMGVYFTVDAILERTKEKTKYLVSWWRTDDATRKRVSMDLQQEWVIKKDDDDKYREVE